MKNPVSIITTLSELNTDFTSMRVKVDSSGIFEIYGFLILWNLNGNLERDITTHEEERLVAVPGKSWGSWKVDWWFEKSKKTGIWREVLKLFLVKNIYCR